MNESFRTRGGLWVIGQSVLMLAVLALGVAYRGEWDGATSLATGTFLGLAGAWLGICGARALGEHRTAFPKPQTGSKLVQNGVYGIVRHPLYASVILLSAAWSLLWRSGPAFAATALLVVFLDAKARREERWLRTSFEGYAAYAKRVRRLIPWIY
ncbi:MAG: isoprenylcysteine carboxylmethyltransferase family protein [Chthoniobacteraceae bacterium]